MTFTLTLHWWYFAYALAALIIGGLLLVIFDMEGLPLVIVGALLWPLIPLILGVGYTLNAIRGVRQQMQWAKERAAREAKSHARPAKGE